MTKISLGSWAFTFGPYAQNPVPFDRIVKRLAEADYDGIEVCGFPPHVTLERYPTHQSRQEIVRLLSDHDLQVSGYAANFGGINPVAEGNKQSYLDLFRRMVDMCVDIGSPAIRVDTVMAPGSVSGGAYLAAMNWLASVWAEAAEIAARGEVKTVWEFEPGFLFNKPSEIIALHQKVDHPNFQILFDTSHAYMCGMVGARQHGHRETLTGGVPEFLKKLEGRIGAIHLIDSDGTLHDEQTSMHVPFEEGYIDFRLLAPQLMDAPVEWWCIDLCFWPRSWELIESSREFVLDLLNLKTAA
jgi:sugar phosphate isomerase/epimerase